MAGKWDRVGEVVESGDEASRLLFTPRLYTTEQWSAGLTVDNLPDLPPFHTRTLVFSTPASASEQEGEAQLEWIVELYPKVCSLATGGRKALVIYSKTCPIDY